MFVWSKSTTMILRIILLLLVIYQSCNYMGNTLGHPKINTFNKPCGKVKMRGIFAEYAEGITAGVCSPKEGTVGVAFEDLKRLLEISKLVEDVQSTGKGKVEGSMVLEGPANVLMLEGSQQGNAVSQVGRYKQKGKGSRKLGDGQTYDGEADGVGLGFAYS